LEALFVKPTNEIYARHLLAKRRQTTNEKRDGYLQVLKTLSKDCNFKNATAVQYRHESIRDAFITGLLSNSIRQRLLENKTLDLKTMFDQARSLESAMKSSESYTDSQVSFNAAVPSSPPATPPLDNQYCGNNRHPRSKCPARDAICMKCQKKGHFAKVCRGKAAVKPVSSNSAAVWFPTLATVTPPVNPASLSKSSAMVFLNGFKVKALFDSSESFIHPSLVETASLFVHPSSGIGQYPWLLPTMSLKLLGTV
jgi:hypothetical protein